MLQELQKRDYKVKPSDFIVDKESSDNDFYPDNVFFGDILIFKLGKILAKDKSFQFNLLDGGIVVGKKNQFLLI